mmetsp:Transcript_8629/g.17151  ORF Transcript_8629/g.17151 Transcript_8629/m.17151 type:complete len:289 (-) Transcript_8629:448-1314(-)
MVFVRLAVISARIAIGAVAVATATAIVRVVIEIKSPSLNITIAGIIGIVVYSIRRLRNYQMLHRHFGWRKVKITQRATPILLPFVAAATHRTATIITSFRNISFHQVRHVQHLVVLHLIPRISQIGQTAQGQKTPKGGDAQSRGREDASASRSVLGGLPREEFFVGGGKHSRRGGHFLDQFHGDPVNVFEIGVKDPNVAKVVDESGIGGCDQIENEDGGRIRWEVGVGGLNNGGDVDVDAGWIVGTAFVECGRRVGNLIDDILQFARFGSVFSVGIYVGGFLNLGEFV